MKKFEVRFLSKKEMTNAKEMDERYSGVDDDNLGFCDPVKNRIFVLASKDAELMKYLVGHEMEHLLEEEGTHEDEQGIRHKKGGFFKNFFDPVGLFHEGNILGVGPNEGKAGLGSALGGIGNLILPLVGTLAGGPVGGLLGSAGNALGNKTFGGSQKASYQGDPSQGGGFDNLFKGGGITATNQQSLGQGFGQQGSFSPAGQGYSGGSGAMGLFNGGLGQAGITLGSQQGERQQPQRQSGNFFPSYNF